MCNQQFCQKRSILADFIKVLIRVFSENAYETKRARVLLEKSLNVLMHAKIKEYDPNAVHFLLTRLCRIDSSTLTP